MKRLVSIYCRVSTADQAEKFSLSSQIKTLKSLVSKNRHKLYRVYNEGGVSGESLAGRPEMIRMLADAEAGLFSGVLVVSLDRLSRNMEDNLHIRNSLNSSGVQIITPAQAYDPSVIEHDLTQNIFGSIADYERKRILERCQTGRVEKRSKGGWLGGVPPLGYKFDPVSKSLLVVEADADQVRRIYELSLKYSPAKISRILDLKLSARQVRRMVEKKKALFYSGRVEDYSGSVIDAVWPAILDVDLADRVMGAKTARLTRQVSGVSNHLLTGLGIFRCLGCGSSVKSFPGRKRADGSRPQYYACSSVQAGLACSERRYIKCDQIDALVSKAVIRGLKNSKLPDDDDSQVLLLQRRADEIEKKIQRVLRLILDDFLTEIEGRSKLKELKAQKFDVQQSIAEASRPVDDGSLGWVMSLDLSWENQPEMREVISLVVGEILLSRRRCKVILRPPFEKVYNLPVK